MLTLYQMQDLKSKLKRQIEIVGLCLSQNNPMPLKTFDLADYFGVDEITIKRDLNDLRAGGVDIHSQKQRGVCLFSSLDDTKLRDIIQQYSALCFSDNVVEKSTALLVNKLREQSLSNIVLLQLSIDRHLCVVIDYEKEAGDVEFSREICPLIIFQTDNYWRVLARHEDRIKQYHLNKIIDVRMTKRKFKPLPGDEVEELFKYSWRSWLGPERYKIKLWFSKLWNERLTPKTLIDTESIKENEDGSATYEATVNSLEEIAGWIVTRGTGVKVLEPPELKNKVISLAKEVLGNY